MLLTRLRPDTEYTAHWLDDPGAGAVRFRTISVCEVRGQPDGAVSTWTVLGADTTMTDLVVRHRDRRIVVAFKSKDLARLALWESDDEGETWEQAGRFESPGPDRWIENYDVTLVSSGTQVAWVTGATGSVLQTAFRRSDERSFSTREASNAGWGHPLLLALGSETAWGFSIWGTGTACSSRRGRLWFRLAVVVSYSHELHRSGGTRLLLWLGDIR